MGQFVDYLVALIENDNSAHPIPEPTLPEEDR